MSQQPQTLSNWVDDFVQSGLYPGGTGIVSDIRYRLWDYGGKQPPDSQCAVYLLLTPTDGSNGGAPVEIFWSVGPASDFQPDHTGGFVISNTRAGISKSSNWDFVMERFKMTCGLEASHVNGPQGIRGLLNGEITLNRVPQPKRSGMPGDNDAADEKGKVRERDILVPTRFRGGWERGASAGYRPSVAPQQSQTVNGPATMAANQPAPAYSAPAVTGAFDVATAIRQILAANGGVVDFAQLPKLMLDKLASVPAAVRVEVLKSIKADAFPALAQSIGVTFDGTVIVG